MIEDFIGNIAGIIPAQTFVIPNWDRETLLQRARRFNWEGLMLKYGHYAHWYKLKLEETVDLVVLGFEDGEGKYAGKVGAIRAGSVEGQDLCTVSGMTDEQRFSLSDRDIGRVIEVKHNGLCTKGGLRHPRFIRWRDDKRARECSYDAIMKELKK